jgi:4-amino-4-deoxy-L-arabinose transferase-like glycosyltransferase
MGTLRPPATLLLNAAAAKAFGESTFSVRFAGVLSSTLLIVLIYLLGARVAGKRTGLVAAALCAVYPNFVGFSHYLLSENYFLPFMVAALWLTLRQRNRPPLWEAIAIGVSCGAATLTREVGVVLVPAALAGIFWFRRNEMGRAAGVATLTVATAAAVVVPWSAYLYATEGVVALVSRSSGMNLYFGNPPAGQFPTFENYFKLADAPAERERIARDLAIESIRKQLPWWPIKKLRNVVHLFYPTSYPVKRLLAGPPGRGGSFGEWRYRFAWTPVDEGAFRTLAAWVVALSYIAVAVLGTTGLVLYLRSGAGFLLLVATAFVVPVIVTFANTRFRLPIEGILLIGTALLFAEGRTSWREAGWFHRGAAVAAAAGMTCLLALGSRTFLSPHFF